MFMTYFLSKFGHYWSHLHCFVIFARIRRYKCGYPCCRNSV